MVSTKWKQKKKFCPKWCEWCFLIYKKTWVELFFFSNWTWLKFDIVDTGTAAVAKAMSNYLDSLLGNPQKNFMKTYFPIHMDFLGEYPDVASFLFIMSIASNLTLF